MAHKHIKKRQVTILDVAHVAKVSKSTVSLVLQGSRLIPETTSEKVRQAAAQLGYSYNRRAADLRRKSSNTVGVVINNLRNSFFNEILVGLERQLVDSGYIVFIAHTDEDHEKQQRLLTAMREHGAAGIALCPAIGTPESLPGEIQSWGIPLIVMIRSFIANNYDYVGSDNALGVKMAMQYLIARGEARIAFIGGIKGPVFQERLVGYKEALKDARVSFNSDLVIAALPTREGGYDAMIHLLETHPKVKAAVCYNDLVAFGALSALGERGMRAGIDFALMGFDNVLDAAHSNPPLSTIDVDPEALGAKAGALLLARIKNPEIDLQRYIHTPCLVLRQSA